MFTNFIFDVHLMPQRPETIARSWCILLICMPIGTHIHIFQIYIHFNINLFCHLKNEYFAVFEWQTHRKHSTNANLCKGVLRLKVLENHFWSFVYVINRLRIHFKCSNKKIQQQKTVKRREKKNRQKKHT